MDLWLPAPEHLLRCANIANPSGELGAQFSRSRCQFPRVRDQLMEEKHCEMDGKDASMQNDA